MRRIISLLLLLPLLLSGCALVNQTPEAVIDASIQVGPAPLTVQFDAGYSYDDGMIAKYSWNFGDPQDATLMSTVTATHTYTVPGLYRVKLTVTDDKGKINSEDIAITVTNPPPLASFTMSSNVPTIGEHVNFNAAGSYDTNGDITSYTWDLGDGTTASGVKVTHMYAKEGTVTVILTVTDNDGETTTAKHLLTVQKSRGGCSGGTCGGDGDLLHAVVTVYGTVSCNNRVVAGEPILFDGSGSIAEGAIVSYEWNFGDGTTADGERVEHTYQEPGYYPVTLTVINDLGLKDTTLPLWFFAITGGVSCY